MASRMPTSASRPARDTAQRRILVATAGSMLLMAVLAPLAQFGVLEALIEPADAAATTANIAASTGTFSAAIAALSIVVILDVVIAWGFYVLLRPVDQGLARIVAWLRVIYAAAFAVALLGLVDAARLVSGADVAALQSGPLQVEVTASVTSFDTGWDLALGIFGLHLLGLGYLLFRFAAPRLLAALVAVAGGGYLADAIGTILVPDYSLTIGTFTFVGEALLIVWLFWRAARGARAPGSAIVPAERAPATAA